MADQKILNFAVLGIALAAIAAPLAGTTAEAPLAEFITDFNTFATQEEASKSELESSLNDSAEIINDLKSQLAVATDKAAAASAFPVVEVDSVKYEVRSGAKGIGSAADIAADPDKAKLILSKTGQTILTQI